MSRRAARAEPAVAPGRYRIQTVARLTGLGAAALRAWERRYGLVAPARGESGYREYTDDDLKVLQRARRLLDAGLSIGEVARTGREALLAAATAEELLPAAPGAADSTARELVEQFVRHVRRGEVVAAEEVVARALHGNPLRAALRDFVRPTLVAVGEAWEREEITPGVERVATYLLRAPLESLLASANTGLGPVEALCAPAPGDCHELGALMVALELARAGLRAMYLGGALDAEHVTHVAALLRPRAVCVSFVRGQSGAEVSQALQRVRAGLPTRVRLFAGGAGLAGHEARARRAGAAVTSDAGEVLAATRGLRPA